MVVQRLESSINQVESGIGRAASENFSHLVSFSTVPLKPTTESGKLRASII